MTHRHIVDTSKYDTRMSVEETYRQWNKDRKLAKWRQEKECQRLQSTKKTKQTKKPKTGCAACGELCRTKYCVGCRRSYGRMWLDMEANATRFRDAVDAPTS